MARIRVTLKWIKILDTLEPFFKETGEFRFCSRVSSESPQGFSHETRFPEEGHYSLSDKPGWNYVTLNKTLFEGDADDHLVVELFGEELDTLSANDEFDHYKREHRGPVDDWVGLYEPADEGSDDPEAMKNWRISYVIERGLYTKVATHARIARQGVPVVIGHCRYYCHCVPLWSTIGYLKKRAVWSQNRGTPMSGAKKTTRYPPATAANGATAEAIAKALLAPLAPLPPKK